MKQRITILIAAAGTAVTKGLAIIPLVAGLAFTGCSDSHVETIAVVGTAGGVVSTPGGGLILKIPEGAIPEEAIPEGKDGVEIRIRRVVEADVVFGDDDDEEDAETIGYQLAPETLEFEKPITVCHFAPLPSGSGDEIAGGWVGLEGVDGGVRTIVDKDRSEPYVEGKLAGFGVEVIRRTDPSGSLFGLQPVPDTLGVGGSFTVRVSASNISAAASVIDATYTGSVAAPLEAVTPDQGVPLWPGGVTIPDNAREESGQEFTYRCTSAGTAQFEATIVFVEDGRECTIVFRKTIRCLTPEEVLARIIQLEAVDGGLIVPGGFGGQSDGAPQARLQGAVGAPQLGVVSEAQAGLFEGLITATYIDPVAATVVGQGFPGPTPVPGAIGVAPMEAFVDGERVQAALTFGPQSAALQPWDETTQEWGFTQELQFSMLDAVPFADFSGVTAVDTSGRRVVEVVVQAATGFFGTQTVIASVDLPFGRPVSAWAEDPAGDVYVVSIDDADAGRLHRWDRAAAALTLLEDLPDGARRVRGGGGLLAVSSETSRDLRVVNPAGGSALTGEAVDPGLTLTAGDGSIGIDVEAFGDVVGVASTGLRDDTWWVHWFERPDGAGPPVLRATTGPMGLPDGIVAPVHATFVTTGGTAGQATVDVAITAQNHVVIFPDVAIPR